MLPIEKKIAAWFFRLAAKEFGHHGCNDVFCSLIDNLSIEEAMQLIDRYNSTQPESEEVHSLKYILDFMWMDYFAGILKWESVFETK